MPLLTISSKCPAVFAISEYTVYFLVFTQCIGRISEKVENMTQEVTDKGYSRIDVNLAPQ